MNKNNTITISQVFTDKSFNETKDDLNRTPLDASCINNFKSIKLLVIGDIILDKFEYGKVERISPEAPVPIFKFDKEKEVLGGAGNVAANLASLGCITQFLGIVGQDYNGIKIASLLHKLGIKFHLLKLADYKTIVKTRLIAGNNHLLRTDQEEILPTIESLLPRYKKILDKAIKNADIVLLSDYNKGLLTNITTEMIIDLCNKYNKKVIIDPKGSDYSKYAEAFIVKPNLKEFSEATNIKFDPLLPDFYQKIKLGAQTLFKKHKIKNFIVTLSEHGMLYISAQNDELLHIPTKAKEVFDVSGAGDTTIAVLGAAVASGLEIKNAMELANLAAGIVVGKLGTATVSIDELSDLISSKASTYNSWEQEKKIISLEAAKKIILNLKKNGKKIGFTNGCFDCCHLGHLNSFIQAKKLCDKLIVAVNSDASVKRYKGPNRPIQDEKTRALLLASMEFIDYVIVFEEDSPLHIVEALKPDIVAKEGYTLDKWPEGRLALSYGGQAITLKRIEGYSTSYLVKKMKG